MKVNPIVDSLQSEHIVAVQPTMSPDADAQWHRRLHLYTGRALSDAALTSEQEGRAGWIATWGQTFSPGVVSGLEVTVDVEPPIVTEEGEAIGRPIRPTFISDAAASFRPTSPPVAAEVETPGRPIGTVDAIGRPLAFNAIETFDIVRPRPARFPRFFLNIAPGFGVTASGEDVVLPNLLRLDVKSIPVYAPAALLDQGDIPPVPDVEERPTFEASVLSEIAAETRAIRADPASAAAPASSFLSVRRAGPPLKKVTDPRFGLPKVGILLLQPIAAELVGSYDPTDPCEEDPANYAFEDWQKADGCRLLLYTWPEDWLPLPSSGSRWRNRLAYAIFNAERNNQPNELLPWEEIGVPIALVGFDSAWNISFVDRYSVVRDGGKRKRRAMFVPKSGNAYLWQARLKQFAEQLVETDSDDEAIGTLAAQFRYLPPVGVIPKRAVDFVTGVDTQNWRVGRSHFFPATYFIEVAPVPMEQLDVAMKAGASLAPFDTDTADRVQVFVPVPEVWFEPDLLKVEKVAPDFQNEINRLNASIADDLQRRKDVRRKHLTLNHVITGKDATYAEVDPELDAPIDPAEDDFGTVQAAVGTDGNPVLTVQILLDLVTQLEARSGGNLGPTEILATSAGLEQFNADLTAKLDRASDRVDFGFLRVQTDIYRARQLLLNNVSATRLATSPVLASIAKGESAMATKENIEQFLLAEKAPTKRVLTSESRATAGDIGATSSVLASVVENKSTMSFASFNVSLPTTQTFETLSFAGGTAAKLALDAQASGQLGFFPGPVTTGHIEMKAPIIGQATIPRTVTIAERIEDPKSAEMRNYCAATKFEVITSLIGTGIKINDIVIPGVLDLNDAGELILNNGLPQRKSMTLSAIGDTLKKRVLAEPTDPQLDEAKTYSIGVELLEHTITFLRSVEARIQEYKAALALCQETLEKTRALRSQAEKRLAELEHDLAEGRHDLTVTKALLVDETDRMKLINERRDSVVRDHVRFLAYQRPRLADLNAVTPTRTLDPAITESPIPACLGHDAIIPADLRAAIALFREAPIKWFPNIHPLLDRLDRIEMLHETIASAKLRARGQVVASSEFSQTSVAATSTGMAVRQTIFAQREVVTQYRALTSNFDLSVLANQSWKFAHSQAKETVSLGDVIEAGHGRTDVAQQAGRELENISRIAACLFANFGEVAPALRLKWVEAFSQYDAPVNLRNLAVLPSWHKVEFLLRRELQTYVDWLFQQVDPREASAVSLVSDLVRICLLLASHAPVNQIVAGHVPRATPVKVGGHVELAVDHTRIRVGMSVLMYSKTNEVVARGVVEDIVAGKAAARVVTAVAKNLDEGARVHFAESRALEINPLTKGRLLL
jgi:hypothetical protein